MQLFHIRYRNTQGTLMRILNAASRRGLELPAVQAAAAERDHQVTLALDVNQKQTGQLYREWYSIADVIHVGQPRRIPPHGPRIIRPPASRSKIRAPQLAPSRFVDGVKIGFGFVAGQA